jgi:isopentenyldiphosphate isomerase
VPRAGPVSARTMEIMSRVKFKAAAPKGMSEEEIDAVLSDKDIFLTPRKKRVRMAPLV